MLKTGEINELSLFGLQSMFSGAKSMAIVGSASTALDAEHGSLIDSHDIVIRFNRATTNEHARCVGSRTDIVVANEANCLKKSPPVESLTQPKCVVTFIKTPSLGIDPKWRQDFSQWLGNTPLFLSTGPEILCCDTPKRRRGFSMGTYALASLPYWLGIEQLFVTGFTMFGAAGGKAHHYCKPSVRVAETWHDATIEKRILANVLASLPCELHVTEDVGGLLTSEGFVAPIMGDCGKAATLERVRSRPFWYLLERISKAMLTAGYATRRCAEKNCLATR